MALEVLLGIKEDIKSMDFILFIVVFLYSDLNGHLSGKIESFHHHPLFINLFNYFFLFYLLFLFDFYFS